MIAGSQYTYSFEGDVTAAPWSNPGWSNVNSTMQNTNGVGQGLRPSSVGVMAAIRYDTAATATLIKAKISITTNISVGSGDSLGPTLFTSAGVGYLLSLNGTSASIRKRTSASGIGSTVGGSFAVGVDANTNYELWYNKANGDLTCVVNDVVISTTNDTDYQASTLYAGCFGDPQNNNGRRIGQFGADLATQTIDTLGDDNTNVRVGATEDVTTTGLGTLTTASTIGGKAVASVSAPSGDGTVTLASFVDGQTYPAMGTQSCVMSDGSLTATTNRNLTTMDGWQYVTVSGLDTGDFSLGKAFTGGDTPSQLHVIDDGVGTLNADGTLTDWPESGVYTAWARMNAGTYTEGTMKTFTFTVTAGGVVILGFGLTKNWIGIGIGI
jgi:hypothetical protein